MRAFIFSFAVILLSLQSFATIRTVSNSPLNLAQFNTIQAAIDASSPGDTVYVHGSLNQYANFTITNKQLVIIGPGWTPDKSLPLTAQVAGCSINGATSSNTEIQGLVIIGTVVMSGTPPPNNLRFIRNQFNPVFILPQTGGVTYSGYVFEGNFFNSSLMQGLASSIYQNFMFQNNIFHHASAANFDQIFNSVNFIFNHNLWYGPASGSSNCFSGGSGNFTFTNNIFVRRNAANFNSSSTFTNNITFNAGNDAPWTVNGNIDGGGNVAGQDPQMAAQVAVNAGTNNPLLDFTIAAGSANNSGSDGKDMGLLFDVTGSLNWANSRNSRLPRIFLMNIVNPTVATGGTINVTVEARTSN